MKPVSVFYSYARADARHQKQLAKALSPLRRKGLIEEWWDGEILPGQEWEAEILSHLQRADVFLLLISDSFVSSEFCWRRELDATLERVRRNEAVVIPIILKEVNWEGLGISRFQVLPEGGKPITRWRPVDSGWKNVCKGVERLIRYLRGPRPVNDVLSGCREIVESARLETSDPGKQGSESFESVAEFWNERAGRLTRTRFARVPGTFSQFAPVVIGPPKAKRRLHKEFRRAIEIDPDFARKKTSTIDACMSVSAGQLVWRLGTAEKPALYFGLYDSIVRNSIPVMVSEEYWEKELERTFQERKRKTFEATVVGKVIDLDNSRIRGFFRRHEIDRHIPPPVIADLCTGVYGLLVDGQDTWIKYDKPARYLDGDIWIATESNGRERFLTTFLNIADPVERKEEHYQLMSDLHRARDTRILAHYDEMGEFAGEGPALATNNDFLEKIWGFGLGTKGCQD